MSHPVVTPKTYAIVFVLLLALTALTVTLATQPLGHWDVPVALGIATVKALLVAFFFMHMVQSSRLAWLAMAGAVMFLAILLGGTMNDYISRGWKPESSIPPPPAGRP